MKAKLPEKFPMTPVPEDESALEAEIRALGLAVNSLIDYVAELRKHQHKGLMMSIDSLRFEAEKIRKLFDMHGLTDNPGGHPTEEDIKVLEKEHLLSKPAEDDKRMCDGCEYDDGVWGHEKCRKCTSYYLGSKKWAMPTHYKPKTKPAEDVEKEKWTHGFNWSCEQCGRGYDVKLTYGKFIEPWFCPFCGKNPKPLQEKETVYKHDHCIHGNLPHLCTQCLAQKEKTCDTCWHDGNCEIQNNCPNWRSRKQMPPIGEGEPCISCKSICKEAGKKARQWFNCGGYKGEKE